MTDAAYDTLAETFDRRYQLHGYPGVSAVLRDEAACATPGPVVEIGCGTGHWLALMSNSGCAVAGLDPSAAMLAQAATKVVGDLRRGRAETLPWPDDRFALVVFVNALHHCDDQMAALGEAVRVLRPGGRLLTIGLDPHTAGDRWHVYDYFPAARALDERRFAPTAELRRRLAELRLVGCRTEVAEHLRAVIPAERALANGQLDRASTSQLSLLPDQDYGAGIERVRHRMHECARGGTMLELVVDLRLHATSGTKPA